MRIRVLSGPDELGEMAATTIAGLLTSSTNPRVDLSVSGGSTVRATYNRLLEEDVAWERVDPWLGDERWVPHDHRESNGRMVDEILTGRLPTTLLRPEYSPDMHPHASASRYEGALRQIIPEGGRRPHLAVLGVGDDGHTASLFPGCDALTVGDRLYTATHIPSNETWRLTSTIPTLHATQHLVFIVAGSRKAEAVAQFLEGEDDPLPARIVADGAEDVTVLLDAAAAERLTNTRYERI
jgi:6-phosphogluconolactonase